MKRALAFLALLLGLAAPAAAESVRQFPLEVPPGAGPVRLSLPAEVLAASRSDDLADLRLVDATGRTLAMARLPAEDSRRTAEHRLVPLPVLGRAGTLDGARLTLRIDPATGRQVAELEGALRADEAPTTLALLLDTRALDGAATRLRLEGDIPANQPVRLTVEASEDLAAWRPIGEQTLFRSAAGQPLAPVTLDGSPVRGRYLRLRWQGETPLMTPVVLRAARLETRTSAPPPPAMAAVPASAVGKGRGFALDLPTPTPVTVVRLRPAEPGLVVPVRILGRAGPDGPWQLLGTGTAMRLPGGEGADAGAAIPLSPGATRQLKVEAVEPSEGFPSPPDLALGFAASPLVFVPSGNPPYRATIGVAGAKPAWLSAAAMAPALGGRPAEALPEATLAVPPAVVAATALDEGLPRRTVWLWAVLLAGVLALAVMAWRLMRA